MGKLVQGWIKFEYAYDLLYVPGPRATAPFSYDDLATTLLVQNAKNDGADPNYLEVGDFHYIYQNGLSYAAVAGHMRWVDNPNGGWINGQDLVHVATEYAMLRYKITDIVYDPAFSPPTDDAMVGLTIHGSVSGFKGGGNGPNSATVTHVASQWHWGWALVDDEDGDGRDDNGGGGIDESRVIGFDESLGRLFDVPEPSDAGAYMLDLIEEFLDYSQGGTDSKALGRVLEAMKKFAGRANAVLTAVEMAEIADRIHGAANPEKAAFVEFVSLGATAVYAAAGALPGALLGPIGMRVGRSAGTYVYTRYVEENVRAAAADFYDRNMAPPGAAPAGATEAATLAAVPDPAAEILFDRDYYLAQHGDARDALLAGTAASAYAHFMAVGAALGYRPHAGAGAIAAADLVPLYLGGDPAAALKTDLRTLPLGHYMGDGASDAEAGLGANLAAAAAAPWTLSAALFALASRLAIDIAERGGPSLRNGAAVVELPGTFLEGAPTAPLLAGASLRHFALPGPVEGADRALLLFKSAPAVQAALAGAAPRAVGIAEYGGVWVLSLSTAAAGAAPPAEVPFAITSVADPAGAILSAGTRAARLIGQDGDDRLLGGAFADLLTGGEGSDYLHGGAGDDAIEGGAGVDFLTGGPGADRFVFRAAAESDAARFDVILDFEPGVDKVDLVGLVVSGLTVEPEGGYWRLRVATADGELSIRIHGYLEAGDVSTERSAWLRTGTAGIDTLDGGAGDDRLYGLDGDDMLRGGDGGDLLDGGAGADAMAGGGGNDIYAVDSAGDSVSEAAGGGTDEVRTALGSRTDPARMYVLPAFVERLTGTAAAGQGVYANALDNVVATGGGADLVVLHDGGNDKVASGGGDDYLYYGGAFTAADANDGGAGVDTIGLLGRYDLAFGADDLVGIEKLAVYGSGNAAAPNAYGLATVDANVAAGGQLIVLGLSLSAGESLSFDGAAETDGRFDLRGGRAADVLIGGAGADIITGNLGADTMTGGGGKDVFAYMSVADSTPAGRDIIRDFAPGDRIALTAIDADGQAANGNSKFAWIGSAAFSRTAGELRAVQNPSFARAWTVEGDTNGDGTADFSLVVVAQPGQVLGSGDFFL